MKKKDEEARAKKLSEENEDSAPEIEVISGEFPLYRTYGVTKRHRPMLTKLKNLFSKSIVLYLIIFQLFVIVTAGLAFWFYSGELIGTVVSLIIFSIFFTINTRIPRARLKFRRKLKKMCKEKNYRLEFKRGFWKSLTWADKGELDFILKAGRWVYYVRYATATKYLSTMSFLSKNELCYIKHPRDNKFTLIFDFKDKKKTMQISFPKGIDPNDKYSVKAILINPVPMNIVRSGGMSGGTEPTGTGEKIFDFTIFNGVGFLETIQRNAEQKSKEYH